MRRTALVAAGLVAAACAASSRPPAHAPAPPAAAQAKLPAELERHPGEIATSYDLGGGGKPRAWTIMRKDAAGNEVLVRREKDLDGDGKVDTWELYGPDGKLERLVYDLDFDGAPDLTFFFENGQLVRKEHAFGQGGRVFTRSEYEGSQLVRKGRDARGRGRLDTWEYWERGELDRIGVDDDGDGRIDRWEARSTAEPRPTDRPDQK